MRYKFRLKFFKAAGYGGLKILNGRDCTNEAIEIPNSILFRVHIYDNNEVMAEIKNVIPALPGYSQLETSYANQYGINAIPAKNVIALLDLLVTLTKKYHHILYVGKNEFDSLVKDLMENGHLTPKQVTYYKARIPVVYDLEEMKSDAEARKDIDLALKVAQLC